jgi:hypothetical protein
LTFKNSVLNYNDTIDGVIKQYVDIICNIK